MKRHGEASHLHAVPNRNGSHEDRAMAAKALPSIEVLRQLFELDAATGKLFWRHRDVALFSGTGRRSAQGIANLWNSRHVGREALTHISNHGYRVGHVCGVRLPAHRLIFAMVNGFWPETVDHINGNKLDNRPSNLRAATFAQNSRNYKKPSGRNSKFRGVYKPNGSPSWVAAINCSETKKKLHLGCFASEIDAALAYDAAACQKHGEFATLNFPAALARLKGGAA